MTEDDDRRDKSDEDGDQSDPPSRDARGRWLKGHCPNPRGRPKKQPKDWPQVTPGEKLDPGDLRMFGSTLINVVVSGEKQTMDRRAALLHKIFESAMKGRVSMQRFLYQEFEKNTFRLAQARVRYDLLVTKCIIENPHFGEPGYELPFELKSEIQSLQAMLEFYHPGQYAYPDQLEEEEDDMWDSREDPDLAGQDADQAPESLGCDQTEFRENSDVFGRQCPVVIV